MTNEEPQPTETPTPIGLNEAPDPVALERGRLLFARECTFIMGAVSMKQLPEGPLPEIAFAGRSNVGKSSLVNALTGRKTLARTSNTPGRTQQLNFFDLAGRLMMVDLPGYGFARAPEKTVQTWTRLIEKYLRGRPGLRRVCVLIDARHGLKETDRTVMALLDETAVVYQLVLTKIDKISATQLVKLKQSITAELGKHTAAHPQILATSARDGIGIGELRAELTLLANPETTA